MMLEGDCRIERHGSQIRLISSVPSIWFGAWLVAVVAAAVGASVWSDKLRYDALIVGGLIFILAGLLFVPRTITTSFDVATQSASRTITILFGLFQRCSKFAFRELKGIGLKEYNDEGYSYMPVLTLVDGRRRYLAALNGSALTYAPLIDQICAQTGLLRVDFKGTRWGW